MEILVTGAAGFIGFHLSKRLLQEGYRVIGIDNLNSYYQKTLKNDRVNQLKAHSQFNFYPYDICNQHDLDNIFIRHHIEIVIHLAAQAGVRYSIQHPHAYTHSNLLGFMNILEACRHHPVDHLIYASSSSVYGANAKLPFSTQDNVDHPVSLYAATKKANELMAHSYSHLFHIPTTGLRFFTVYGPWGRPDMAYYTSTKNIIEDKPIKVFNNGQMERDFTYIDDIVEGILSLLNRPPTKISNWDSNPPHLNSSKAPHTIFNIGNNSPVKLMDFISILEELIGKKAKLEFLPMQPGDVTKTYADITDLQRDIGFSPSTPIELGLRQFVNWYKAYYN